MATYIEFDGIKGESQFKLHKDAVDVLSWSWGVEQPRLVARPNRAPAGKPEFDSLNFQHELDRSSPELMKRCASGEEIASATLYETVSTTDEPQMDYLVIEMDGVTVARVDDAGGGERPMENVALNFDKIRVSYNIPGAKKSEQFVFGWNIKANKKY